MKSIEDNAHLFNKVYVLASKAQWLGSGYALSLKCTFWNYVHIILSAVQVHRRNNSNTRFNMTVLLLGSRGRMLGGPLFCAWFEICGRKEKRGHSKVKINQIKQSYLAFRIGLECEARRGRLFIGRLCEWFFI